MLDMVRWLWDKEGIKTEPSANAGLYGIVGDGVHMVWLTGGSMVPRRRYLRTNLSKKPKL